MSRYVFTYHAGHDVDEIDLHLSKISPRVGRMIGSELLSTFKELFDRRFMGQTDSEATLLADDEVRSMLVGAYRLYYFPNTNPVMILGVLHTARDAKTILRQRLH